MLAILLINAIEANARQYVPEANKAWEPRFPGVFRVTDGTMETALLTDDEKRLACRLACDAGARFVKTSTGFHPRGGATVADVRLLRAAVGPEFGVKASGGIRSLADAQAMIDAGANRLGTSASAAILGGIEAAESTGN